MPDPSGSSDARAEKIERFYEATAEEVWDLWTTSEGIESWWAPDGFEVKVRTLDLRPGGELVYEMAATGAEQIEFMKNAGMPLTTESRKTFTELDQPTRIAYTSLADFIPGVEPYEFLTVVDLEPRANGVRVVMTMDAMHDAEWTQRLVTGRTTLRSSRRSRPSSPATRSGSPSARPTART
ncbi:MAG: SRPBCC family protein [Actinomycetota bacterium]